MNTAGCARDYVVEQGSSADPESQPLDVKLAIEAPGGFGLIEQWIAVVCKRVDLEWNFYAM
jgi:hypothetical protein